MALNGSPEFCLTLIFRYLLKADHVPDDTWGEQTGKRSTRSSYIPNIKALGFMVSN